jgi:acetyl esterase
LINLDELEPGVRRFLDEMRADWSNYPPFETMSFPEQRAVAEKVRARWTEGGPVMAQTIERTFDPGAGTLRTRTYLPIGVSDPAPALIYLHGGGFTLFSIDTHDRLMREYAARGGFAVIGIDYPLAPEAKYPVALNRIEAFLLWLRDHGGELGVDPTRVALGGDSAGANLSFSTTLRLRERGEHGIVRAILSNYGGFSAHLSDEAEERFGGPGSIMDRQEAEAYWANYLNHPDEASDPLACPIVADLLNFPPVMLVIPDHDIVTEHSIAMDARLREAGVETHSKIYRGAIHSFLEAMSVSALAREAIQDGADFIRSKLG